MRTFRNCKLPVLAVILACVLFGCASSLPPGPADKNLLLFLDRGPSMEEVLLNLGEPSATFEKGRILTYRIGGDKAKGYFLLGKQRQLGFRRYSLVLVFDENGFLKKHALVQIT